MSYFCGVDIGGTFTDCVVIDDDGKLTLAKVSSTPPEFARGFHRRAGRGGDQARARAVIEFLKQTSLLLHGTTVGTNVARTDAGAPRPG